MINELNGGDLKKKKKKVKLRWYSVPGNWKCVLVLKLKKYPQVSEFHLMLISPTSCAAALIESELFEMLTSLYEYGSCLIKL